MTLTKRFRELKLFNVHQLISVKLDSVRFACVFILFIVVLQSHPENILNLCSGVERIQ